jgi:uncharacterized membrane protein
MSLSFSNSTAQPIWVVIAYSDSDCTADGGSGWMKEGWWQIAPGTSATAHGGLSNGAKYFYFAEDNSGRVWSGEFGTSVPREAFTQCWSLGNTDSQGVSMRKLEVPATSFSYTVNLTD